MLALQIKEVKTFMSRLLSSECFDSFLLEEATIQTYNTFTIDGHQNKDFYSKEELEDETLFPYDYSLWKNMRGLCFDLIKGKKAPTFLKIILHLTPEASYTILEQGGGSSYASTLKAFVVTIRFDQNGLLLTTGTSLHTFLPDRTPDLLWDNAFKKFLTSKDIEFEEL